MHGQNLTIFLLFCFLVNVYGEFPKVCHLRNFLQGSKEFKGLKNLLLGSFSNSEIIVNEPTYNVIPITYERVDAEPRHNHNQELNRQRNGRRKSRTRV